MRRVRKEKYYKRWRREHPELRMYLSRDEYEFLKGLADSSGRSLKDIVLDAVRSLYTNLGAVAKFIDVVVERLRCGETIEFEDLVKDIKDLKPADLSFLRSVYERLLEIRELTLYQDLDMFIDGPEIFYYLVVYRAEKRGLKDFEPALLEVPCSICGEPMIITHKLRNWSEIKSDIMRGLSASRWGHADHAERMPRS